MEGEQEAQLVMFAMPKGLPTPVDSSITCLEEKRVLYARWNTECQSATAVVDPSGTCEGSSRLKTQRVTYVGDGKLGFTTAPWSPPAVLGMTMNGNPLDTVPMDGCASASSPDLPLPPLLPSFAESFMCWNIGISPERGLQAATWRVGREQTRPKSDRPARCLPL